MRRCMHGRRRQKGAEGETGPLIVLGRMFLSVIRKVPLGGWVAGTTFLGELLSGHERASRRFVHLLHRHEPADPSNARVRTRHGVQNTSGAFLGVATLNASGELHRVRRLVLWLRWRMLRAAGTTRGGELQRSDFITSLGFRLATSVQQPL